MRSGRLTGAGIAVVLGAAACPASTGAKGAGTTAFQFLTLGSGPRIEALGGAGTAIADGVDALVWNPARLNAASRPELAASYFNWLDDVQAGYAGLVWPVGSAAVGLGVRSLSVPDFGNLPGEPEVGQSDLAVAAGGAYPLAERLDAGLAFQIVRSTLADEDATGLVGDAGLSYQWVEGWTVACAVRNFGRSFGYVPDVDENLPTELAVGLGSTFGELRVDSEVLWEDGPGWMGVLGAELRLRDRLSLRLGSRLGEASDGAREPWAAGIGVAARQDVELEYAFRDGVFDASHRLGIRWIPGRSLGRTDEGIARSPREFYLDVLNEAIERSLVTFPADIGDTVVVRGTANHTAEDVISETLAGRLRDRGLEVDVLEPEVDLSDLDPDVREAAERKGVGVEPEHPLLSYDIVASDYELSDVRRERWVGPKSAVRRAAVDLTLTLTRPGDSESMWSSQAQAEDRERVATARVPISEGYPRKGGVGEGKQKLHPLVEPAIVGGLVTGLAVIFFSNRSVGE